jgi:IPT/TIG domain
MAFVGHGWRSGQASDITGPAPTCTVSGLLPSAGARKQMISLTVQGTGFDTTCVIHSNYAPVSTTFSSATQLICPSFNTTPDSGLAGAIPVQVRKGSESLSNMVEFTAT